MYSGWKIYPLTLSALCGLLFAQSGCTTAKSELTWIRGGVERGPATKKIIALEFTGGSFGEGGDHILSVLKNHDIKASFFFTGDFFRTLEFEHTIKGIVRDGHYLGIHSDKHLLYCPWDNRDKTLVTKEDFIKDILASQEYLKKFGVEPKKNRFWIPPYEWYNEDISRWSEELGLILINFSPGSYSNADYTEEADKNYRSSDFIYQKIFEKEEADPNGLNGFLLLVHIGAGPGRKDKFFLRLEPLLLELEKRGYSFVRVDEMLDPFFKKP
jgi:peptidoglycan/xylan/chitin deacetylase (PgdA/CDA1 family)